MGCMCLVRWPTWRLHPHLIPHQALNVHLCCVLRCRCPRLAPVLEQQQRPPVLCPLHLLLLRLRLKCLCFRDPRPATAREQPLRRLRFPRHRHCPRSAMVRELQRLRPRTCPCPSLRLRLRLRLLLSPLRCRCCPRPVPAHKRQWPRRHCRCRRRKLAGAAAARRDRQGARGGRRDLHGPYPLSHSRCWW